PPYGIAGAGIATSAAEIVALAYLLSVFHRHTGIRVSLHQIPRTLAAVGVMVAVWAALREESFFSQPRLIPTACAILVLSVTNFSELKNSGITRAGGDWVLIIDADERVPADLRREIELTTASATEDGFVVPCTNYFFGQKMHHGGWSPDEHIRLFRRGSALY